MRKSTGCIAARMMKPTTRMPITAAEPSKIFLSMALHFYRQEFKLKELLFYPCSDACFKCLMTSLAKMG